ncbi:MAG TPA: Crp/Fnr family transcriptional regulator [Clostridia bacterium]|nr:Crp/Fnr family transcriptional regulator [Clostridia bacterium]
MDPFEHLRRISIFSDLDDSDLEEISGVTRERWYKKGMVIFYEGDPGDGVFFIRCGKVKITKSAPDGRQYIVHILGPGDVFAEAVLFDGRAYPATAEVIEDAQIGLVRNSDLERLIEQHPSLGTRIIKMMAKRLVEAQERLRDMALEDAFSRIVSYLLCQADHEGKKGEEGIEIDLGLTRNDLASIIGATRETVSRILNDLKKARLISLYDQRVVIHDAEALRRYIR